MFPCFRDRRDAGELLATALKEYANRPAVVVLALPRGGVPVGYEVARVLHAPLDVFVVRKLGVPGHEELAMGAVASGGFYVVNERVTNALNVTAGQFDDVLREETAELLRREKAYRGERPPVDVSRKIAIVVDDGLATGASMSAAITALRTQNPKRIVVAVPVCAAETGNALQNRADEFVCVEFPERFGAVGLHYMDFRQITDEEVHSLLDSAQQFHGVSA